MPEPFSALFQLHIASDAALRSSSRHPPTPASQLENCINSERGTQTLLTPLHP